MFFLYKIHLKFFNEYIFGSLSLSLSLSQMNFQNSFLNDSQEI